MGFVCHSPKILSVVRQRNIYFAAINTGVVDSVDDEDDDDDGKSGIRSLVSEREVEGGLEGRRMMEIVVGS